MKTKLVLIDLLLGVIISNNSVTIFVGLETGIASLAPEFALTSRASITPPSGTEDDFNSPQQYTVPAADGIWSKKYTISVIDTELATNYNFEDTLDRRSKNQSSHCWPNNSNNGCL